MGNLIFVEDKKVSRPYYVQNLDIHLYSAEELSYYIYNYQYFLDKDFMDERLLEFIGKELKLPVLEKKLRKWFDSADFFQLLALILQEIRYYSDADVNAFLRQADIIRRSDPEQLMKKRGDFLLSHHSYFGALEFYDKILSGEWKKPLSSDFRGKVWFNKGGALAGMFSFQQAMAAFEQAYQILGTDEALRKIYEIHLLDPLTTPPLGLLDGISPEVLYKWKNEFEATQKMVTLEGKAAEAEDTFDPENENREQRIKELLKDWKTEYRRMI